MAQTNSKDNNSVKETSKATSKPSNHDSITSGTRPAGYNPFSGTFHTLERANLPSSNPVDGNGHIDDADAVSTNGSWSGESEDHKEKPSQSLSHQESVPGADCDKREKIRQKNERKHQRQKERRAKELHERCSGYLMSRKLEALAQQLVSMGFSQERAMMALILNEGRVEESVSWLFEGSQDEKLSDHNLEGGSNVRIDISEELAHITKMEIKYKASKQEVERAVVSCEGDLEKAEEILKSPKEEPLAVPLKTEVICDPLTGANNKQPIAMSQNPIRIQLNSTSSTIIQQKRDEKDLNYTKVPGTVGSSMDPGTKTMQLLKKIPPKSDWGKPQQIATSTEKRWEAAGFNPSPSFLLASSLQPSPPKSNAESHRVSLENELKNLRLGSVKEPVIMQRPQSIHANWALLTSSTSLGSSPPGTFIGRYPNSLETKNSGMFLPPVSVSRNLDPNIHKPNPLYNQPHYQPQQQQFMPVGGFMDSLGSTRGNGLWTRGAQPALAPASSLGLFSGTGTNNGPYGSSSSVDWDTGSLMLQLDYTNIDWSLDHRSLSSSPSGLWTGANRSVPKNARMHDSFGYSMVVNSNARQVQSNGNGPAIPVLQDGVPSMDITSGDSLGWSSPREDTDVFSVPRRYVSYPSL